eukprot:jgi/Botrbrau1/13496/Bobra.0082s0090.2
MTEFPGRKWRGYQAAGGRAWITLHDKFVRYVESVRPEVLFFGDGFVEQWRGTHSGHSASAFENHKDAWIKTSEDLGLGEIGLFGICGDGIGNLMWRILDGEMPVTWAPRVVLLSIGTSDMQTWGRRYLQHVNPGYLGSQFEQLVSHILEKCMRRLVFSTPDSDLQPGHLARGIPAANQATECPDVQYCAEVPPS